MYEIFDYSLFLSVIMIPFLPINTEIPRPFDYWIQTGMLILTVIIADPNLEPLELNP